MPYTHRPTDLQGVNPGTDRTIFYEGNPIARVYQFTAGPQQGEWGWFGYWAGERNSGVADTRAEALQAIKGNGS